MTREHLGLFDTPPDRREILFAAAVVGVLFAACLVILPLSNLWVGEIAPFVPVVDAVVAAGELIIATKLYAQSAIFRSRALTMLASGFLCVALLFIVHGLTMPGGFARNGLLGPGTSSTAWLMLLRRFVLPIAVVLYVVLEQADLVSPPIAERPHARLMLWIAGAILVAASVTMLAFWSDAVLPPLFIDRNQVNYFNNTAVNVANIIVDVVAIVLLWSKRRSVLDTWLLVALAGWLMQSLLNLPLHDRFTLGWYAMYLVILVSHLFVLLALMGESNRLYARLALSTAGWNREREARMMSMNAVAATISHEVGQPLVAIKLNVSTALRYLTGDAPNPEMATKLMRAALDAGDLSIDVLKSIKATFSNGTGSKSEFDVNDLARETASLLGREFAAHRVSLRLALDEALPPILANRVQIERVLVNLLHNAMEAIGTDRRGKRCVTIRSMAPDRQHVMFEVSDTGTGIDPERMATIFEPFVTTKRTGTGLGLSLSRTIVEEHGGKLWASSGSGGGATFHVKLPCTPPIH